MKNKKLQIFTLVLLCILLTLATVLTVRAEEMQTIVTDQQEIEIPPAENTSIYVYLTAEVPIGWGGDIEVCFHNEGTGKEYKVTMNYIKDGYNSGLWLPFGFYGVEARQPEPDGLCMVRLEDSTQNRIQVKKGESTMVNVLVEENPEFETGASSQEHIQPPKEDAEYQDLPTVPVESNTEPSTENTEPVPQEEEQSVPGKVVQIFATVLVIILILAVVGVLVMEYQERNAED